MLEITVDNARQGCYDGNYLRGMFPVIAFTKYRGNFIAIPGVTLNKNEKIIIHDVPDTSKWGFWTRSKLPIEITYSPVSEKQLSSKDFELFTVV